MASGGNRKLRQFVCVEYPGYVKNVDKMIETLGGMEKISEVYCEDNRRMELRFRPTDFYCKPTCGERHNVTSILLKVVRRKKKKKSQKLDECVETNPSANDQEGSDATIQTELLGVVHTKYKFNNMCDFQYVPLVSMVDENSQECVYDDLVPQGMEKADWLNQPAPLFLPPAAFSRMDTPQDYRYRREANAESKSKLGHNIICRTRQRRTHFAIFLSFKDEGVPTAPLPGAMSQVRVKFMDNELYSGLQKEFLKRPIWSKNALKVRLGYSSDKLKYLLPTQSFYFHTGPWRNLWIVFGYDPRKDPTAWIYQTFDYRIRQAGGVKTKVEAKRSYSNYILPYKSSNTSRRKTSVIQSLHLGEAEEWEEEGEEEKEAQQEELYIFRPGKIPPYRQMFYQFCDIHVPEIQSLLEESILSGANQQCTEKYGWLPAGVEKKCRDIMSNLIEKTIAENTASGEQGEEELHSDSENEDSIEEQIVDNSTEEELETTVQTEANDTDLT